MNERAMRSLLLFLAAWVVVATIVTYGMRRTAKAPHKDVHFQVPVYPGAINLRREGAPETRWVRVTYELDARPPATQVVQYYERQLAALGWRAAPRTKAMEWQAAEGAEAGDFLWRKWLSEDELLRFDLGLTYRRGEEAMPGRMTVGAEVGRNFPITRGRNPDGQRPATEEPDARPPNGNDGD